MSIEAINWVIHNPQITDRTEFCVMFALANRAQPEGHVTIGSERWARESRCSRATLQRAAAELIRRGFIARDLRPGRANTYRMLFPAYPSIPLIPDHRDTVPAASGVPHGEAPTLPGVIPNPPHGEAPHSPISGVGVPHGEAPVPHQMTRHPRHLDEARTHSDSHLQTHASPLVVDNSTPDTRLPTATVETGLSQIARLRAQLGVTATDPVTHAPEDGDATTVAHLHVTASEHLTESGAR